MPRVTIKNDTQVPLHIALRRISPVHFVNNVPPGGEAVFKHVGRVWFTIEARLARKVVPAAESTATGDGASSSKHLTRSSSDQTNGLADEAPKEKELLKASKDGSSPSIRARLQTAKENNEYTLLQTFAAPVAITVAALSLGAGAVYLGVTATAAGGLSAALSSMGAQVGATAAAKAPTIQRLYKYAKKGYQVAQIGSVVGIGLGGKAVKDAGKKGASAEDEERERSEAEAAAATSTSETARRLEMVKETLSYLITHNVVKSHGWFMKRDRTFTIRGGPRAAELEEWVIIETDTVTPFEVVPDTVQSDDDRPDPNAQREAIEAEKTTQTQ